MEVRTHLVGDGSDVDFEVRTKSGKTLGQATAQVGQNFCTLGFTIPEKTAEDIFFEAELPDHGLKARSNLLRVLPRRVIRNARWDRKEARRGDVVKLLADTENIPDSTEVKVSIFEHDADEAHDLVAELAAPVKSNKVELEWEYEFHEDTDDISTDEESEKGYSPPEYFFKVSLGPLWTKSELLQFKDWLEISFPGGAGAEFVLHLADGKEKRGKFDDEGMARVEDLPPGPVRLEIPDQGTLKISKQ